MMHASCIIRQQFSLCARFMHQDANMIHASCITRHQSMCARFTHHGIGFNLEGCPQAIAVGGWGQPEKSCKLDGPSSLKERAKERF
jgi:hypothetical protein